MKTVDSLAVRYRPRTFDELAGQEDAVRTLKGMFASGKINKTILISGATGCGKCLGKGTPVLLFDGSVKPVEEVVTGDLLMGFNGEARRVLSTNVGTGDLFQIDPFKGDSWVCNDVHVLTLVNLRNNEVIDIPLDRYQKQSTNFRDFHKLFRQPVDFPDSKTELDPYSMGVALTESASKAVVENKFRIEYQYTDVESEKRIPRQYLVNSSKTRLEILAGLLDASGHLHSGNCFEIGTKYIGFKDDILFLARSLGFSAYAKQRSDAKNPTSPYWRIVIGGHTSAIPTRLEKKKASVRRQVKDVRRTGFSVKPLGIGDYYGFELDGDGRFLLGDFTVTHNTSLARLIVAYANCQNFDKKRIRPCGTCDYCVQVKSDCYPDVDEINFSDTRGIETVRNLIESSGFSSRSNVRAYILDEIQNITTQAQGALLKPIEEPPEDVLFLLLTTDPHRLLPTIQNRCLRINLNPIKVDELTTHLDGIAEREGVTLPEGVAEYLAKAAKGHVRLAISFLESVILASRSGSFDASDAEKLEELVGKASEDNEVKIAEYLIQGIYAGLYSVSISKAQEMVQKNANVKRFIENCLKYHEQTLYALSDPASRLPALNDPFYASWRQTLGTLAREKKLKVVVKSASAISQILLELVRELGRYEIDASILLTAYTCKLVDAVQQHDSDIPHSPFHKKHAGVS